MEIDAAVILTGVDLAVPRVLGHARRRDVGSPLR